MGSIRKLLELSDDKQRPWRGIFFSFFFFVIDVQLTNNIILAAGVQHNDSVFLYITK